MRKVTIQTVAMNVPPQDVITKDNVTMRVDAVVYARVVEPVPAVVKVQNYLFAVSQSAQTNLRAILGKYDLDTLLSDREAINRELHGIIARVTHDWGVEVLSVEVKDVDLPDDLRRAMAREAEADREARALMISADAERRASRLLSDAAAILSQNPQAMQIRFLQTVAAVATEQNSTLVMPIPIELLSLFGGRRRRPGQRPPAAPPPAVPPPPSSQAPRDRRRTASPSRATAAPVSPLYAGLKPVVGYLGRNKSVTAWRLRPQVPWVTLRSGAARPDHGRCAQLTTARG